MPNSGTAGATPASGWSRHTHRFERERGREAAAEAAAKAAADDDRTGAAGHQRRTPSGPAHRLVPLAVALGYLAVATVVFRSAWAHLGDVAYGGSDAMLYSWYLGWTPHALAGGLDPFVTHHFNAPDGANLLWSTPVFLLGLLAAPVTALFGPVTSLTVLITLAPAVSGFALFAVLRRWVRAGPAAVAGLLYGFGPYVVGASYGHLHLTFAPFPPLLLLLLDDLVVRGRPPRRTGVLLGLAVATQALIGEEILATSALTAAVGLAILAVGHRDRIGRRLAPTVTGLGIAGVVAAVLLAWPLAVQFRGEQRVVGSIQPHGIAVSDLLTFITPTPMQQFAPLGAVRRSLGFTGNAVEVSGYLGIPLLAVLVVIAVMLRRHPLVRLFAPLGLIMMVLSLGGHLHVNGRVTGIPLPWLIFQHLPVLGSALPSRFALYVGMCAAIMLAAGLDRLHPRPRELPGTEAAPALTPRGVGMRGMPVRGVTVRGVTVRGVTVRVAAAGLALAALVPLVPATLLTTSMTTPAFFTGDDVTQIPAGATALVVPFPHPQEAEAMLWQARAGYRFVLPGCYCTVPGPDGRAMFHGPPDALTSALIDVDNGDATASAVSRSPEVRAAYARMAPDAVVLGPARHHNELRALLGALVGTGPRQIGGVDLWLTAQPRT